MWVRSGPSVWQFPKEYAPVVSSLSVSPAGSLLEGHCFPLCIGPGQLICLLIPWRGRNTVGRYLVNCDLKPLVFSPMSSRLSAPHSGRCWTSRLSVCCCPLHTVRPGDRTWFMHQRNPSHSQLSPLTADFFHPASACSCMATGDGLPLADPLMY